LRHDLKNPRKYHPREESSYRNMMSRCYNPKATGYNFYGGRGITVCERWQESFWNFYEDMGIRAEGLSLDRIDPNGPYCKENCRWATAKEQGNNTTKHYVLKFNGLTQNLSEWGESLGILPNTIYYRLARGWTPAEALEKTPRVAPWQRRFSPEKVQWIVDEVEKHGRTQLDVAAEVGLHSSQVSRLCARFGTKLEKEISKKYASK
jgi:hypothetical protein